MAYVDINVRYATSTYLASCPGRNLRASNTMGPEFAARRLAGKLHPTAVIERVECLKDASHIETGVYRCHLAFENQQ